MKTESLIMKIEKIIKEEKKKHLTNYEKLDKIYLINKKNEKFFKLLQKI